MIKWLKQFFCSHSWIYYFMDNKESLFCSKCGKFKGAYDI